VINTAEWRREAIHRIVLRVFQSGFYTSNLEVCGEFGAAKLEAEAEPSVIIRIRILHCLRIRGFGTLVDRNQIGKP
jgi:hypothetical protein